MESNIKKRKPIYRRWWLWVIVGVCAISIISSCGNNDTEQELAKTNVTQESSVNKSQDSAVINTPTPTVATKSTPTPTPKPKITTAPTQKSGTTSSASKSNSTSSTSSKDQTIVYYVPGSNVYHLSKDDSTLSKSKTILSMTLAEALKKGMHQSKSKADQ